MEGDSSDDENYKFEPKKAANNFHPWFKKGYKHIYDELDFTQ